MPKSASRVTGWSEKQWRRHRAWAAARTSLKRYIAAGLTGVLVAPLASYVPAQAAPQGQVETAQRYASVRGENLWPTQPAPDPAEAAAKVRRPAPVWPSGGAASVSVAAGSRSLSRAGNLPVRVGAAGKAVRGAAATDAAVRVEVLSRQAAQAAGVNGLLLRLGRTDRAAKPAAVSVEVDFTQFATAYGADWASRLQLMELPECAMTTPGRPECRPVPTASRLSLRDGVITADVSVAPGVGTRESTRAALVGDAPPMAVQSTFVALMSGPSGGAGSFGATSLSASSNWGHTGATGGFTWAYPMRVPPAVGGPGPQIGLAYSSQSVDGRHAASNNQPGWIGEGFSYEPGYIERRYRACSDDMDGDANNDEETGDLCWATSNAIMSLNGSSVELIQDGDGLWHPVSETGARIEKIPGAVNGARDGEHWKMTAPDGTRYYFGLNRLKGWTSNKPETNSVLTVPVAGNNPDEPCHKAAFADSFCEQAWRWQLDYIEDVHGNTSSIWYERASNHYARNLDSDNPVVYHRDGYPVRIDYGTDNRSGTDTVYTATPAPAQVHFGVADRCLANCGTQDAATWPDTPWDQECAATGTCLHSGPTFWSQKRLSVVTTKVWDAAGAAYQPVDSWTLRHSFPDPGDGTRAGLWLEGITHRGLKGTTITSPEVTLAGVQMKNRVDITGDFAPAMTWWRIGRIELESGGEINVSYSPEQCAKGGLMPSAAADNRLRCYPVKWTPDGYTDPRTDYFHKYVVTEVQQIDHSGGAPAAKIFYEYENPDNLPLWHYDPDDGLVDPKRKTWGQWRGYPYVVTKLGEGAAQQVTRTLYYRGMHGDKAASGTRTVNVTGLEGGPSPDLEQYAGMAREQIAYLDGQVMTASVITPWSSPATATRTVNGSTVESRHLGATRVEVRTALDGGDWQRSASENEFDDDGRLLKVRKFADLQNPDDDECTVNEYLPNEDPQVWILHSAKRTYSWVGDCDDGPASAAEVLSDTRFSYDQAAFGVAPTKGLVSAVERMTAWNDGNPTYQPVGSYKHDAHGRTVESIDITGEKTTAAFTPATGGPVTQVKTTTPAPVAGGAGWPSTVTIDPAWGVIVKESDVNARITEATYDALGRRTAVWLPGRARGTNTTCAGTCNVEYEYILDQAGTNGVVTKALNANGDFITSYDLYDSLLRPRQTQSPAVGGGRIITDNFYDTASRVWKSNSAYYHSADPGTTLYFGYDADVPTQTRYEFDSTGRITDTIFFSKNVEKWRSVKSFHGDHVTTTPPEGGTATAVYTDEQGRLNRLLQFHGPTPTGPADETKYSYHPSGELKAVVDASGNTWSWDYDELGRLKRSVDPDKGTSSFNYDIYDRVTTSVDEARDVTLAFTYDRLGRPTTIRDGSDQGAKRVEWTYDLPAKGLTKSVSRWIGSDEYKTQLITVDAAYRPTQTRVTIPAGEGALAGTYAFRSTYNADGSPDEVFLPAAGGLAAEVLKVGYDEDLGLPRRLTTNYGDVSHYVVDAGYTQFGEVSFINRATALTGAPVLQTKQEYEEDTHRLSRRAAVKTTGTTSYITDAHYKYDEAGNLIKIDDNPAGGQRDTQCFSHDHLRRLVEAWTPASADCSTDPQSTPMGGPAPYWQEWDFGSPTDAVGRTGSLLKKVDHLTPAGALTTEYQYPVQGDGEIQPHLLEGYVRKNAAGTVVKSADYDYDGAGNTTSRPGPNGQQELEWDAEGNLASVTDADGKTDYVYDGVGNRLLAKSAAGKTLYLGGMQIELIGTVTKATRYYNFNGEVIGQRTGSGLTWLCGDHQGTGQLLVTADAQQTVTQRRQKPYGEARGPNPSWVNKKGFVGGDVDPTGLVHLGAREYDPEIGRFISVDPVLDIRNPQQIHGYIYAGNNPVTWSDPTGLLWPWDDDCKSFMCGITDGFFDALNILATIKALWALIQDPEGAWEGLKAEAEKWEKKTGDWVMGWVCALSGICALWESCVSAFDPYECGKAVGGALADAALSLVTGGAGAAARKGAALAKRIAEKFDLNVPGIRDKSPDADLDTNKPAADEKPDPIETDKNGGPGNKPDGDGDDGNGNDGDGNDGDTCKHSFAPETTVVMADGSAKPIAEIVEGEKVTTTDPETGQTSAKAVVDTHINIDTALTDLVVQTEGSQEPTTLKTTQHHPFWNGTTHEWSDAADLLPGQHLKTLTGETAVVLEVTNWTSQKVMHDLTVADIHTYYVITGPAPVLVHNCGDDDDDRPGEEFTDNGRDEVYAENEARNGGQLRCDYCNRDVTRRPSRDAAGNGIKGLPDDAQIDHEIPKCDPHKGCGAAHNGRVACRACNRAKSKLLLAVWDALTLDEAGLKLDGDGNLVDDWG